MSYWNKSSIKSKIIVVGLSVAAMPVLIMFLLINFQKERVIVFLDEQFTRQVYENLSNLAVNVNSLCMTQKESIGQMLKANISVMKDIVKRKGGITLSSEYVEWETVNQLTQAASTEKIPKLLCGGQWLGQNKNGNKFTPIVDEASALVDGTCTIFQKMNGRGDMLRVATNVMKKDGSRAIGTYIPARNPDGTPNPVVSEILKGEAYHGRAFVVDSWYMTTYEPIKNGGGDVIGMLYVGIKQENVSFVRESIMSIKNGASGYMFVLEGSGANKGSYVISKDGKRDGEKMWESKDSNGEYYIQKIINESTSEANAGKVTFHRYLFKNEEDAEPRMKIAAVIYFKPWDWVIGASAVEDELLGEITGHVRGALAMLMWVSVFSGIVMLTFGGVFYLSLIRKHLTDPLKLLVDVANKVNEGDMLQKEITIERDDEIGKLAGVFNKLFKSLEELVNRATSISQGVIGANETEAKLRQGLTLSEASKIERTGSGLSDSFDKMQGELRKLTIQARRISTDDLNNPLLDIQITGELGEAFSQMTSKLKNLANIAKMIAEHDLTSNVTVNSENEVLANSFAKMVKNLKELIAIINNLSSQTQISANDMSHMIEESNLAMNQIQSSIKQIASTTSQISASSQDITKLTQRTNEVVMAGNENIANVIDKFVMLQRTMETTGSSIARLDERSQKISEIVGLITHIADQTNLLALNAAIEAARAGESGRGFAVVADEVRKLAESSGRSAEDISKIIKEILHDTGQVVSLSNVSLKEANVVLELSNKMKSGYKEIIEAIKGMDMQVRNIAAISEETAASSEEITANAESQSATLDRVLRSAKELVGQATALKSEIGKFKV